MEISSVGVIGAGVMGTGVAQNFAQFGFPVVLVDISSAILEKAKAKIVQDIRLAYLFNREKTMGDPDEIIERITFTADYDNLRDVDFLIENVTEKFDIKKGVYAQIDRICKETCLFAANTSAIPITKIASMTNRPSQFIGIHFMNPVPMKSMVEVIKGYHTSEETIETTRMLLERISKESVLVNDSPGFVSNRVLMLTINEAIFLVQDQVASAEDVDKIFKGCFEHKMGPLETADLIGLDTILYSIEVLYECYNDSKYRPSPLLKKMVDAGMYGRKSGKGFYNYEIA